jgi:hypothetical protein
LGELNVDRGQLLLGADLLLHRDSEIEKAIERERERQLTAYEQEEEERDGEGSQALRYK